MGLLDWGNFSPDKDKNTSINQGLLAMGLSLLNSKGSFGNALGQAGLQGMDAQRESHVGLQNDRLRTLQRGQIEAQMAAQKKAAEQAQIDDEAFRAQFSPTSPLDALSGGGGPTNANAERIGQMPQFDPRAMLSRGASPEAAIQGLKFNQAMNPTPQYETVAAGASLVDPRTGKPVYTAPKERAPSSLSQLITEMNSLPLDDPRRSLYMSAIAKETTHRPGTNVNVNTAKPLMNTVAEGLGKQIDNSFGAAQAAVSNINTAQQLKAAVDSGKIIAGPGSSFRVLGLQIGQMLGVGGKDAAETLANTRTAIQSMAKAELDAAQMMKGQGQITEAERDIIRRAAAGDIDKLTGPEVRLLAEAMEKTARYKIAAHQRNTEALGRMEGGQNFMPFYRLDVPPEYSAPTPQQPAAGVRRYNPATGRIE